MGESLVDPAADGDRRTVASISDPESDVGGGVLGVLGGGDPAPATVARALVPQRRDMPFARRRPAPPLLLLLALPALGGCGPDAAAGALAGSSSRSLGGAPAADSADPADPALAAGSREAAIADQLARDAALLARGLEPPRARDPAPAAFGAAGAAGAAGSEAADRGEAPEPTAGGSAPTGAPAERGQAVDPARAATPTARPGAPGRAAGTPAPPAWNQSAPGGEATRPAARPTRQRGGGGGATGPRDPDPAILGLLDPPSLEPWSGGSDRERSAGGDRFEAAVDRATGGTDPAADRRRRDEDGASDRGAVAETSPWMLNPFGGTEGSDDGGSGDREATARALASAERRLDDAGATALPPDAVAVSRSDYRLAMLVDAIDHPDRALGNAIASAFTLVGDPDASLDPSILRGVPEADRDLVEAAAEFAQAIGGPIADASRPAAAPVDRETLLEAIDELRARVARTPTLTIGRAALCTAVEGFGLFTALPSPHRFLAGRTNEVILYVEVDDFHCEQRAGGAAGARPSESAAPRPSDPWVTQLGQRILIYNDRDARPVWDSGWEEVVDVNANRRRDFFTGQVLRLPPSFSLGTFLLKVQVRDELTGAEAETTIEFEMVAGGAGLGVD